MISWGTAVLFGTLFLLYGLAGFMWSRKSPLCRWFAGASVNLFLVFAAAKLLGWTSLPWWQVFGPLWFPAVVLLAFAAAGVPSGDRTAWKTLKFILNHYAAQWKKLRAKLRPGQERMRP